MSDLYQKPAYDMVGKILYDLAKDLKREERDHIQSVLDTGTSCRGDRIYQAPSGKKYFFEYIYTPIFDENGKIEAIAGNSRDITERKFAEEKIAQLANTDALTGLPNRRLFSDRLKEAIKQVKRENKIFALLSIDLDKFKKINDKLGHEAGDILLQQVGKQIIACLRKVDTVARMGGDEFSVILSNVNNTEQTRMITDKILTELTKPFQVNHHRINISASIGVAFCPQNGIKAGNLLSHADKAMYVAKKTGRNQCVFYSNELSDRNN